jgi:hypothetical protein
MSRARNTSTDNDDCSVRPFLPGQQKSVARVVRRNVPIFSAGDRFELRGARELNRAQEPWHRLSLGQR